MLIGAKWSRTRWSRSQGLHRQTWKLRFDDIGHRHTGTTTLLGDLHTPVGPVDRHDANQLVRQWITRPLDRIDGQAGYPAGPQYAETRRSKARQATLRGVRP